MRTRLAALGCSFAGALGLLALAPAAGAASLPKPGMSVSTPAGSHAAGSRIRVTVTLNAKEADASVKVYASPVGGKPRLVSAGQVDSKGKYYANYTVSSSTTFTATFNGNAGNAATSASRKVTVAAHVADGLTGYFKTTKISGVSYRVFHGSATLTLKATVSPGKHGECLEPETQQWDSGTGWDADTKYGCDKLNAGSHDSAAFKVAQAVGDRYRIRADYIRAPKDTANLSADGAWLYLEVVK